MNSRAKLTIETRQNEYSITDDLVFEKSPETNPEKLPPPPPPPTKGTKPSVSVKQILYLGAVIASIVIFKRKIF